jgi:hypothetical protein
MKMIQTRFVDCEVEVKVKLSLFIIKYPTAKT